MILPKPARNGPVAARHSVPRPAATGGSPAAHDMPARTAMALAAHASDLSSPLAEFSCATGGGGAALAGAGFACIDGFDASGESLAAAARRGVYRRLVRAGLNGIRGMRPGTYANAAVMTRLDPAVMSPQLLDDMLALLPPGGCLAFVLPGGGASVGRFRTRVLELCEHFVAEPVFRGHAPGDGAGQAPGPHPGLPSTVYVLKKR